MRIFLSLLIMLYSAISFAECHFKKHITKIYSFSGVSSVALREMGLLKNPVVKGISVFNPVDKKDFSGTRFPGGIFLSRQSFAEFGGGVVFFDESRELSRMLIPMNSIQAVEIKTRNKTPLTVTSEIVETLNPFLEDCDSEKKNFIENAKIMSDKLLSMMPPERSVVYYLGEFQRSRPPELLMVNDGIVKWLLDLKKIKSYPSPLAYVNWSAKIMRQMPKGTLKVAINDSEQEMIKQFVKSEDHLTLTYPGALVPGISQIEAWIFFEEKFHEL